MMVGSSHTASPWLDEVDWHAVQAAVPIACVDVLPVQRDTTEIARVGLILRETPHQGKRWCLIGGRLFRDESFSEAVTRQLVETLGTNIRIQMPDIQQPTYVAQYFSVPREIGNFDPRQHAVGLIFCVAVEGQASAIGEALDFRWFDRNRIPSSDQLGFGQEPIVAECLKRLDAISNPV